ncbi:hypothetical protein BC830DRAFT_656607 [Chytriomyces sp. MP71]|nr:hypothetical protein BC830DRAFT_656607 [Chytriomyces sp. MP71]
MYKNDLIAMHHENIHYTPYRRVGNRSQTMLHRSLFANVWALCSQVNLRWRISWVPEGLSNELGGAQKPFGWFSLHLLPLHDVRLSAYRIPRPFRSSSHQLTSKCLLHASQSRISSTACICQLRIIHRFGRRDRDGKTCARFSTKKCRNESAGRWGASSWCFVEVQGRGKFALPQYTLFYLSKRTLLLMLTTQG